MIVAQIIFYIFQVQNLNPDYSHQYLLVSVLYIDDIINLTTFLILNQLISAVSRMQLCYVMG